MKSAVLFSMGIFILSSVTLGAIPIQQATSEKKNHYFSSGVFVGGFEQGPLTLLNVRHSYSDSSRLERLVLDFSNLKSSEVKRPGFFHASIQQNKYGVKRIVLDLSDILQMKVTEKQVRQLLSKSRFFSSVAFYKDELSKSITVELILKTEIKCEVFELASHDKPGRIVIDVKAS